MVEPELKSVSCFQVPPRDITFQNRKHLDSEITDFYIGITDLGVCSRAHIITSFNIHFLFYNTEFKILNSLSLKWGSHDIKKQYRINSHLYVICFNLHILSTLYLPFYSFIKLDQSVGKYTRSISVKWQENSNLCTKYSDLDL